MTDSSEASRPTPGPSPAGMPRRQFETTDEFVDVDTEGATAAIRSEVEGLLQQVDSVRHEVGDTFDLRALEHQTALLEQAHDALTAALDAVDRR
ncbi:hypothetical protein [Gordonia bronchialis]|uniref:hypothetical protein n=1 Tax=Gordonia bronchialis TaxID=2054 RepID=UPI00242AC06D|nr:hypothetical protein [Gordonia bronchialis]